MECIVSVRRVQVKAPYLQIGQNVHQWHVRPQSEECQHDASLCINWGCQLKHWEYYTGIKHGAD